MGTIINLLTTIVSTYFGRGAKMSILASLKTYLYGAIFLALLFVGYKVYSYVDDIKSETKTLKDALLKTKTLYDTCSLKLALERANNNHLKSKIAEANKKTLTLAKEYEEANKRYQLLKHKPVKVRREYVDKFINREVESDECKEIKTAIDNSVDYINSRMQ